MIRKTHIKLNKLVKNKESYNFYKSLSENISYFFLILFNKSKLSLNIRSCSLSL